MLTDKCLVDLRQGILVTAHNDGVVVLPEHEIVPVPGHPVKDVLLQGQVEIRVRGFDFDEGHGHGISPFHEKSFLHYNRSFPSVKREKRPPEF